MKRSIDDIQGMLHVQTEHGQNLQKDQHVSTEQHTLNMNLQNNLKIITFYVQYEIY